MSTSIKEFYTKNNRSYVRFMRTEALYEYVDGGVIAEALSNAQKAGESLGKTFNKVKADYPYRRVEG